ncbi:Two-component signal transduction system YycFG, regulatory protein YycH [Gracilibacillus ureilyticus]|uniref:Two-component signal transduction system YycFG, regulatory protein YycH n=1 Tax=Gracilibacillus ureilyticus TaxID=531814 RepID=A0A1H9UYK7_9BACI|nr:two-component system activity regulator YycH [Gracilibacillus ureilyticus]SES14411.1 Two-component signal transduction system YycFG, regulatory protein YycH [Gracilibacillus ureilyticus]
MKFELAKTIILTFLVGLSFLLTLAIWNYDRAYEVAEDADQTTEAELAGMEENKKNLIEPYQIVFHTNGTTVGYENKKEELEIFDYVSNLHLYDFKMLEENNRIDESVDYVELVFPTSMPSSYIAEIISTEGPVSIDTQFKSIKLFLDENRDSNQIIFENSDPYGIDIRANIQNMPQVIEHFNQLLLVGDFITYLPVEVRNSQTIYIPKDANIKGKKFRYTTISPDTQTFQSIFFQNPQDVANSPNPEGGQTYSDGTRQMVVRGYFMEFTDFSTDDITQNEQMEGTAIQGIGDQLLTNSLEHINSHNGWFTEKSENIKYRLYDLNTSLRNIKYRMVYNNYPVFSSNSLEDIATMSLEYRNGKVFKYTRPLMILAQSYDRSDRKLMSAEELVAFLEESEQYEMNRILNIQLGYRIEQQEQVYDLIPTWCVETYNGWEIITRDMVVDQGGQRNAVGTN